eukprot:Gregarina_sp_Poly_1__3048@NODE_1857_length_3192_cov_78_086400_g199_i2_p2_GENE_NODE_1857_length_3192_cov_78_086400_g199_i2NODE_1857_length_3192_cov_78_086400_g199_i2_p2_ORF_typecomplete_len272_score31_99_NODE_1857_length_3192_cov_78_086400_g199_i222833098
MRLKTIWRQLLAVIIKQKHIDISAESLGSTSFSLLPPSQSCSEAFFSPLPSNRHTHTQTEPPVSHHFGVIASWLSEDMISCDKMGRGLVRREEVYSPRSGVGSSEPVPSVSSEQSRKSASFASCEPAGFTVSDGSVMSTTQESIAEECLKSVVSAASHESRRSASESEIPDLWKAMSTQIRSAVSKSMPSTQLVNRTPNYHLNDDKDAMGVEAAPTEYMIEITDELREITEVKMERGDLTHNRETVSMDALLQHVGSPSQCVTLGRVLPGK